MQSDWHRYNLKRRVASLPPLPSETFAEKVLANKAVAAATAAKARYERECKACGKTYYSEGAYVQHLGSGRHRIMAARADRMGQDGEADGGSVMSSTLLLNSETGERASRAEGVDEEAEEEFERVVNGINDVDLADEDGDPVARRPARPRHSSAGKEGRPPHLLSTATRTTSESTDDTAAGEMSRADALRKCLFCTHCSKNLDANIDHMAKSHGMFIPERAYLVHLEGLILYLSRKVHDEYQCLSCGRLKWSEDGIKTHMRDSGHCKIAYDTEEQQLELGDFYDFRSTYSDDEDDEDWEDEDEEMIEPGAAKGGGVKLGAKRETSTAVENGEELPDADAEEEGWETDSTVSDVPTDELGKVYYDSDHKERYSRLNKSRHHSHSNGEKRRHRSVDGFHSHAHDIALPTAVYYDDFELRMPSGRTAGHRSLNRYFRQNLRNYPSTAEREKQQELLLAAAAANDSDEEMVDADDVTPTQTDSGERGRARGRELTSRADGGLGMLAVSTDKRRQVKAAEKRETKRSQRGDARFRSKVDKIGNQQKHFRDPLLQ